MINKTILNMGGNDYKIDAIYMMTIKKFIL